MAATFVRLGLCIGLLSVSTSSLASDLTPEDCVHAYRQALGACATKSCARAVLGALPLPRTARVLSSTATFSDTGVSPISIQVTGRVSFQLDSGPFHETDFSCTVEDNIVLSLSIAKPNLAVNSDARRRGSAP